MRSEIIKFDRYQEQFRYLMKTHIETAEQLSMQYDAIQAEIDALTDRRRELYQWRRAGQGDAAIDGEIAAITDRLRTLRRELKLCARIEGDIPGVRERVLRQQADERGPEKEHPTRKPYLKNGR